MKKILTMMAVCAVFAACTSGKSEKDKEREDSIAAAATADSMLKAATADTTAVDSAKIDSVVTDTLKK